MHARNFGEVAQIVLDVVNGADNFEHISREAADKLCCIRTAHHLLDVLARLRRVWSQLSHGAYFFLSFSSMSLIAWARSTSPFERASRPFIFSLFCSLWRRSWFACSAAFLSAARFRSAASACSACRLFSCSMADTRSRSLWESMASRRAVRCESGAFITSRSERPYFSAPSLISSAKKTRAPFGSLVSGNRRRNSSRSRATALGWRRVVIVYLCRFHGADGLCYRCATDGRTAAMDEETYKLALGMCAFFSVGYIAFSW